jgi:HlyD family secretion protein
MNHMVLVALAAAALYGCAPKPAPGWSGYIEGDYVTLAAPVAGTLARVGVRRGDAVEPGTLLFALDDVAGDAARDEAQARLVAARAQAEDAAKGRRSDEIAVTSAQLAQAKAQATQADAELARQQQLVAQGFVSASRIDDARAAAVQARARVAELDAALRVARLPARSDARAAAEAAAAAASEALRASTWRAAQAQTRAPAAGTVAEVYRHAGEWVGAGQPVLALLPPGNVRARFYVPEAEIAGIAPGQPVRLACDGCAAPIAARIDFVATQAEYTPPVIYSNAQRAKLVFRVEARPAPADAAKLRPGQPVDVTRGP